MALPIVNTPTFELVLPSTGKTVKYRPFLIKEQKMMLIARESGDASSLLATLYSVIDACTFGKLNVESLSKFDVEYIFVKLRSKSVGEHVELNVVCDNCDAENPYTLNLDDIKVTKGENHSNKIMITSDMGIIMRYPTYDEISNLYENNTPETVFDLIISCIDQIFDTDSVTLSKDITREELTAWLDGLESRLYDKIETFFRTQPRVTTDISFKCKKCETENHYVIEGIDDFFE